MSKMQTWQIVNEDTLGVLRTGAREKQSIINAAINSNFESPVRLYASNPNDSLLNIQSNKVVDSDGSSRTTPPINDSLILFAATTIDFQTSTVTPSGNVLLNSSAFSLPTSTAGQYRRMALVLGGDGKINTAFSGSVAAYVSLPDPGTLFSSLDGLPVGYIDLVGTATATPGQYKSASSAGDAATNVIANAISGQPSIFRFGAGGGSSSIPKMTTTQRLALTGVTGGRVVYDTTLGSLYLYNGVTSTWVPVGNGTTPKTLITQASHGFTTLDVGAALYFDGSNYVKARADVSSTAEVVGWVDSIIDVNSFYLAFSGIIDASNFGNIDTLSTSFNNNIVNKITTYSQHINTIVVQPDGKTLIGGLFTAYGGVSGRNGLVRLNTDGTVDTAFTGNAADGGKFSNEIISVILQPDGKILVGGYFINYAGTLGRSRLIRLNSDGTLDTAFSASVDNKIDSAVRSIAVQSDGTILVGGNFGNYGGTSGRSFFVKLNSDGTLNTAFCTNATDSSKFNNYVLSIAVQSDSKILVGGSFTNYAGTSNRSYLIRLNSDGTLDTSFCSNAVDTGKFNGNINAFAVQSDNKILVGGSFTNYAGTSGRNRLIRLNSDGTLDTLFCTSIVDSTKFSDSVLAVAVHSSGKILVCGSFMNYGGTANRNYLISINTDNTLDTAFCTTFVDGPKFNYAVSALATYGRRILIGGYFDNYNGVSGSNRLFQIEKILQAGSVYFLSESIAGYLSITEPSVIGQISKPVGIAISSTSLEVINMRGSVVGSANLRTQVTLSNNAITTIQNASAYEAGEITGWIYISATTPLKYYVAAQFSKNGTGTNYNISFQTSGDTPPIGFDVVITAAGLIQITLPSIAGFTSASINFALNAPAVGTTFPLSISAKSVLGDAAATAAPSGYIGQTVFSKNTGISSPGSAQWFDIASITLTPGIWSVSSISRVRAGAATFTSQDLASGIAMVSGNATTGNDANIGFNEYLNNGTYNQLRYTFPISSFVLRYDGTNFYYADGTAVASATGVLYLKMYVGVYTAGTPTCFGSISAIRIA